MRHSYSRLNAYLRCPRAYKFEYLDGLGGQDSEDALLGSVCHAFFEAYDKHLAAVRRTRDEETAGQIMERVFFGFRRPLPPEIYPDYRQICGRFVERHRLDLRAFYGAEVQIALTRALKPCAWDAPEAWFRFRLDRLDLVTDPGGTRRAVVTDYKTGWGGDAEPFQFRLYAAAVWLSGLGELDGVDVVAEYARSGRRVPRRFWREDIELGIQMMRGYAARLEAEREWAATPGDACRSCAFAALCPDRARNLVDLNNPEDAARAARDSLLLKAQARERDRALRAWVRRNGPVQAGGAVFGFGAREEFLVSDPEEFMRVVRAQGYDPEEVYNGGTPMLRRLCQRDPALADAVAPFVDVKVTETFGARKADASVFEAGRRVAAEALKGAGL